MRDMRYHQYHGVSQVRRQPAGGATTARTLAAMNTDPPAQTNQTNNNNQL